MMLTRAGKKHTIPQMTATAMTPRPKMSVINGVMATSGTARNMSATGMNACSKGRMRMNTHATTRATTNPAT